MGEEYVPTNVRGSVHYAPRSFNHASVPEDPGFTVSSSDQEIAGKFKLKYLDRVVPPEAFPRKFDPFIYSTLQVKFVEPGGLSLCLVIAG